MKNRMEKVAVMNLKPLELDNKTTLVLNNTRELNRDIFTN